MEADRLRESAGWRANQSAAANRRPALQSDGSDDLSAIVAADRASAAAVAELGRSPSQADQDSRQMKTTGHGYASGEAHVVGFRPQPDDNDHRCGTGSALASSAILAARSTSSGSEPDGSANGSQPTRRVAMRMLPVAGSRR
jgi:hypothetical protein